MTKKRLARSIRTSGKLMLTGEYLVLDGARSWAVPTRYGQELALLPTAEGGLYWKSVGHNDQLWFEAQWDSNGELIKCTDTDAAETLERLLRYGALHGNDPFKGWKASIKTEFPKDWGLGSSSSLLAAVAKWCKVDKFDMFEACFTGSGYDVAVAASQRGTIYKLDPLGREILYTDFTPPFADQLFFVYSGKKQNSEKEVKSYGSINQDIRAAAVPKINELTRTFLEATSLEAFQKAMLQHEEILGSILGRPTKNQELKSIKGALKNLGAWGGDFFILATDEASDLDQLRNMGYDTILNWEEIILDY